MKLPTSTKKLNKTENLSTLEAITTKENVFPAGNPGKSENVSNLQTYRSNYIQQQPKPKW